MRIAVARRQGSTFVSHFGRADHFTIIDLDDGDSSQGVITENRKTAPPCDGGSHDFNRLEKTAEVIKDCDAIISSGIGPGAIDILVSMRIYPYIMQTGKEDDLPDSIMLVKDRVSRNQRNNKYLARSNKSNGKED
jgi:predicted Fe-Mo cluster-binding NifX family protein